MRSTVYERRIEQEWGLLQSLAEANRGVVVAKARRSVEGAVAFDIELLSTEALIATAGSLIRRDSHPATLHFPQFFPSMPIEASLVCPVFHPNVHPETGFVCLWSRFCSGDTVIQAVSRLQKVIIWELVNREPDHDMQPAALSWFDNHERGISLPLACQKVRVPEPFRLSRTHPKSRLSLRRRLS